jgi:hypothetical protein
MSQGAAAGEKAIDSAIVHGAIVEVVTRLKAAPWFKESGIVLNEDTHDDNGWMLLNRGVFEQRLAPVRLGGCCAARLLLGLM